MIDDRVRKQAVALYDRFTHGDMDRRSFMTRMVALAGSVAAAEALIGAIAPSPAAAAIVPADDPRLTTGMVHPVPRYSAYAAQPRAPRGRRLPAVIVIHENRGLNGYTRDVARRLALAGHYAICLLYTSPSPRDISGSRMPSSA